MATESKDQNALAEKLSGFWTNFKQGKVISYRWMAILLVAVAAIGLTWYILSERKAAASQRWMDEGEANTKEAQEKISEKYPGTIQDRLARLQIARNLLGESGIELMSARSSEQRKTGVANIETAREMFQRLVDDFKDDPSFRPQCYLGLAKAEAALVAVPATPGQLIEFKGKIPAVVEHLDRLAESAADTPWAADAKKLADALRNEQSPSADEFRRIQRNLFELDVTPEFPRLDGPVAPTGPSGPGGPAVIPGLPR
jgi:hypothetical protein